MPIRGTDPMQLTRIELDGGKYTVMHNHGAGLQALRYGEPWRDLTGDGLVLAMCHRIEELAAENGEQVVNLAMQLDQARQRIKELEQYQQWYDEAMAASNAAGYVGLSAAQTIAAMDAELSQPKE